MTDYQGNSKKQKQEQTNEPKPKSDLVKQIVTDGVVIRPPGLATRFKKIFFGGDMNTAGQYVVGEVLLPALRNLLVETISKGADRLIYGDSVRRRPPTSSYAPRIQYNNPIYRQEPRGNYAPAMDRWRNQGERSLDRIFVATKADADLVIERLIDIWDAYQVVSVADLYELLGQPSSHVDNKWGWTSLPGIESRQTREGYQITLPPVEEIS